MTFRPRRYLFTLIVIALLFAGTALSAHLVIEHRTKGYMATLEAAPQRTVAIVPGARVYADGNPSPVLADRLETALELYRSKKVERILVSGDHRTDRYDEVNAMHRYLIERGVHPDHVFLDHAGFRTLDTMERAKKVFRVEDALICTQAFHLPRAVFLARRAGVDAIGVPSDRRRYVSDRVNAVREALAKGRALIDVYLLGATAERLGTQIPIDGPSDASYDERAQLFVTQLKRGR